MRTDIVREELQWLVQGVEDEISQLHRRLLAPLQALGVPRPMEPASVLAEQIVAALSDAGICDAVIQTFKQAIEDFQKGEVWAQQAMKSTDRRPLAVWSIERLGRARRRLREVSEFVTVGQARRPGIFINGGRIKRQVLLHRDNIKIGSVDLQFINNTDADTDLSRFALEARASLLPARQLPRFLRGIEDPSNRLVDLAETSASQALNVAEKIRATVEHETVKQTGVTASVSIGIARFSRINDSVERLISSADRMLLAAKVPGRNRTMVDEEAHALHAAEKESTEIKTFRPGTRMKAFASPARELTEFTGRMRSVVLLGALVVAGGLLSFYPHLANRRSGIEAQIQALEETGRKEPRQALLGTAAKEASPTTSDARESAVPMPPALALTPPAKETEHFGDAVNLTDKIAQKKSMLTGPKVTRTRESGWRIASTRSVHGRVNEVRFAKTHPPRARAIAILECNLSRTDGNPQGASGSCETVAKQGT